MLPTLRLYYLSLYGNAALALCFLVLLPWLVWKIIPAVRWLEPAQPFKWFLIGVFWSFGLLLTLDFFNAITNSGSRSDIWVKAIAATGLLTILLIGHLKWPWLNSLYPKETLLDERRRSTLLIRKLQIIDDLTPCAKLESRVGIVVDANLAAMQLTGYSRTELVGMSKEKLLHPEDLYLFHEIVLKRKNQTYECRVLHKLHTPECPRIIPVEVRSAQAPFDNELRITFLTDMTQYVEERDRRIRDTRTEVSHNKFLDSARDLQQIASQL